MRLSLVSLASLGGALLAAPRTAMHAQNTTPPAVAAADSTPARAPRVSWTADRRAFSVGDVITVLIDDYTIATAIKDNLATDMRRRDLGGNIRIPLQGTRSGGIDTRNNAETLQRGQSRRENRFQNEMSVRVIATGANGLLQVRGAKNISVDKAQQNVMFEGWLRAQDVSPQNLVESYRIADATITYVSPGPLGKTKSGLLTKILGLFLP